MLGKWAYTKALCMALPTHRDNRINIRFGEGTVVVNMSGEGLKIGRASRPLAADHGAAIEMHCN